MAPHTLLINLIFFLLSPPASGKEDTRSRIESMIRGFEKKFKTPALSVEEFRREHKKRPYVLVDARTAREQSVSMIPGAITSKEFLRRKHDFRKRPIVIYCTIGYRSSALSEELRQQGFQSWNLRGSLLLWSWAGGPLVTPGGKPTKKVHVYGKDWDLVAPAYEGIH